MRQQIRPIHIDRNGRASAVLQKVDAIQERDLQALIHEHPEILPIAGIDPAYNGAVSICRELHTPAGPIDNLLITPTGLPVLVECKLWRNPQARREVIGQALDYARELARWSSSDLEREVAKRGVESLADRVRGAAADFDEAAFHDTLTASLRTGRVLLLIVGDGIKESVEAIFEHLRAHVHLGFSFGLVEAPIFALPDGSQIVVPRVIAQSRAEVREVLRFADGYCIAPEQADISGDVAGNDLSSDNRLYDYWAELAENLDLDDPEQPPMMVRRQAHASFSLPDPKSRCWLTVARIQNRGLSIFLSWSEKSASARRIVEVLLEERGTELVSQIGGHAGIGKRKSGSLSLLESRDFRDLDDPQQRAASLAWLPDRINAFVNALRPAVASVVADLHEAGEI